MHTGVKRQVFLGFPRKMWSILASLVMESAGCWPWSKLEGTGLLHGDKFMLMGTVFSFKPWSNCSNIILGSWGKSAPGEAEKKEFNQKGRHFPKPSFIFCVCICWSVPTGTLSSGHCRLLQAKTIYPDFGAATDERHLTNASEGRKPLYSSPRHSLSNW